VEIVVETVVRPNERYQQVFYHHDAAFVSTTATPTGSFHFIPWIPSLNKGF